VQVAVDSDDAELNLELCRFGLDNEKIEVFLPACERAVKLEDKNADYRYALFLAQKDAEDTAGAAATLIAGDAEVSHEICLIGLRYGREDLKQFLPACARAVKLEEENADYLYSLAQAQEATEDTAASATFERALAVAVESGDAELNGDLCRRGLQAENVAAFVKACERAVEKAPENTDYQYDLGLVYARLGDSARASAALKRASDLAAKTPDSELNNRICWNASLAGFGKDVLAACDRAVALDEDNAYFLDSRGLARAQAGDLTGAVQDYELFVKEATETFWANAMIQRRREWIAELQAGRNPFDDSTLEYLRNEDVSFEP
jgi:tetratricopeptide (TPR) repeat protein